jgi:predicted dehydrogenase
MKKSKSSSRREFIKISAATTAGLTLAVNTFGAPAILRAGNPNDKVRVGIIGLGNRGSQLLNLLMMHQDVEVAALCDVYKPYTTRDRSKVDKRWIAAGKVPEMGETFPNKVEKYTDFRKLLDNKDIDAVCIATPDHWHAVQTISALQSGKDVYVEKPLTIFLHEGRMMVEAQAKTDRVVQVGLNRRGSSIYRELAKEVQNGLIGKVVSAQAYRISNMYPDGIGNMKPVDPPKDFDWDLWLGPRPYRPYQYNIAPYYFRWWKDYSTQMGNWGVHYMDVIRWLIGEQAPVSITAHGGKHILTDDRTIPDTMEVNFEFASGCIVQFHIYEASDAGGIQGGEIELRGTKGTLIASQDGYKIIPAGPGQFQTWEKLVEAQEKKLEGDASFGDLAIKENSTNNLIRNFIDCVKSREKPVCSLEEGHRSTSFSHLANISLETGTRIEWDPEEEKITNNKDANKLLHYEYRKPWKL